MTETATATSAPKFPKVVLILTEWQYIIQLLLTINLMVFKEKIAKKNLLMVIMVQLVEIVVQHKIFHDLKKNGMIYHVHVISHTHLREI